MLLFFLQFLESYFFNLHNVINFILRKFRALLILEWLSRSWYLIPCYRSFYLFFLLIPIVCFVFPIFLNYFLVPFHSLLSRDLIKSCCEVLKFYLFELLSTFKSCIFHSGFACVFFFLFFSCFVILLILISIVD